MKSFLIIFCLLFSSSVFSYEWNLDYLKDLHEGCLQGALENSSQLGEAFEYCGCTTNRTSISFTLNEILDLYESGSLSSNKKYIKLVDDCNQKIRN